MSHGRFDNPVIASLAGIKDFFAKQKLQHRLSDTDRFDGKTVLVTGANSGLGFGIAAEVARRGGKIIMACRSQIPEAGEKIKALTGSDKVEMRYVDLSRIEKVHQFVDELKNDSITLDITFLNAATTLPKARQAESGQDEMFQVNYLANVMLTNLFITKGIINSDIQNTFQPRIIFISSDSHRGSSYIDYDEFGNYFDYGVSKAIENYSYYKLILNTYATELSRRVNYDGVKIGINVICPGPVHSNIVKEAPWLLRNVLKGIFWVIFKSPKKAALPVIYMAISPDYEGKTNKYLHMFNPKRMDEKVYEKEEGVTLWERSIELWKSIDSRAEVINL